MDAVAARTRLAHPERLVVLMGQQGQTGTVGMAGLVGMGVPLSHQGQHAGVLVFLEALYGESHVGLVRSRDDGA